MIPVLEDATLLEDIIGFIRRFCFLTQAQADTCALWVLHTHAIDAADFTPYLHIHSPVLRSGKTRLLEVLRMLVHKPWFTGRVTGSALVRKINKDHPTLLLDESDTAMANRTDYSEHLRGILDSGFERDGTYSMSVPKAKDWEPLDFSTFSPKAIAGIGQLPSTIEDRAVPIRLKRALRTEQRERLRKRRVKPAAEQLQQRAAQWAEANASALRDLETDLPEELNDRQQDVCEPLFGIANFAGGEWPERSRRAIVELCSAQQSPDGTTSEKLLADIQRIFLTENVDRLFSETIVEELNQPGESSWRDYQGGISQRALARLLKPFDITPQDVRIGKIVKKGYYRSDFKDAWQRYLPALSRNKCTEGQHALQLDSDGLGNESCDGRQITPVASAQAQKSSVMARPVADVAPRACYVHPRNESQWWQRQDGTQVCGKCHPNPASI